ncbi:hypothetical protein GAYE_PCTG10G0422 [Galdieria yellowstonensis]|uniref:Glycosyl hydrolase family 13 catalytic domain-containing protein n=1 Tax=Galdieria yellowstonensis TaxID=3028027 RepID=A0AAV9I4U5_9RHOD|nr:hypothetical protein GAYE_PCTG10G0422 [Galdieria yellowstonensis]
MSRAESSKAVELHRVQSFGLLRKTLPPVDASPGIWIAKEFPGFSNLKLGRGSPYPFGVTRVANNGFNFAIFCRSRGVRLCLFPPLDCGTRGILQDAAAEIVLDDNLNVTGDVWHCTVYNIPEGSLYGLKIEGVPRIILDPYAKWVASGAKSMWKVYEGELEEVKVVSEYRETSFTSKFPGLDTLKDVKFPFRLGLISEPKVAEFDWENDKSPGLSYEELFIYEVHVRGFTMHSSSNVSEERRGTFLGMIDRLDYLQSLGVNCIELLPIMEFNELELCPFNELELKYSPTTKELLCNFWGYSPISFFGPMCKYSTDFLKVGVELKTLVKEVHKRGMEIVLDVVYNHTADASAPFHFLNAANVWYMHDEKGPYSNLSGCGNTFNCNHPVVLELIIQSLRWWVSEYHVDGFRFDAAGILCRDQDGTVLKRPPVVEAIVKDPVLKNVKLIAEAWDAGAMLDSPNYLIGSFPFGDCWLEWNGKFRDTVRHFIKGTPGMVREFAKAIGGYFDLYSKRAYGPCHSINFVACHDGFSLYDLVAYDRKHNESNEAGNADGIDDNISWNCGVEGETDAENVNSLRRRQIRNFILALVVSRGVPMLTMGDEYGHSKLGNNNTWCFDNEVNYLLFGEEAEKRHDYFLRFVRMAFAWRQANRLLRLRQFMSWRDVQWHGHRIDHPDWSSSSRFLAFTLKNPKDGRASIYVAFNSSSNSYEVQIPNAPEGRRWLRIVDTNLASPNDFWSPNESETVLLDSNSKYCMVPFSAIALHTVDPEQVVRGEPSTPQNLASNSYYNSSILTRPVSMESLVSADLEELEEYWESFIATSLNDEQSNTDTDRTWNMDTQVE